MDEIASTFMTALRVCFLFNNDFSFHTRVLREVESLAAAGYDVHVICVANKDAHLPAFEMLGTVKLHRILPKRLYKYHHLSFRSLKAFVKIMRSYPRFDVVQANDASTLPLGWLLAKLWRAKLIYDAHEYWKALFDEEQERVCSNAKLSQAEVAKKTRQLLWSRRAESWLLPKSDGVISVCDVICEQLGKVAAQPLQHVVTIRNIAKLQTAVQKNRRLIHEHFSLSPETKVIVYQGQIAEKRGLHRAVAALEMIPNAVLVLMGPILPADQAFFDVLQAQVAQSESLRGRVLYRGFMPPSELLRWTASADLGLQPIINWSLNHYYCLPNKIFEYIQSELPIAVSDFPEMRKIVTQYRVGFTFDPEDPADMAQKINDFFADEAFQEECRQNVLLAKQELCWEVEEKKLLALYETVLAGASH